MNLSDGAWRRSCLCFLGNLHPATNAVQLTLALLLIPNEAGKRVHSGVELAHQTGSSWVLAVLGSCRAWAVQCGGVNASSGPALSCYATNRS